MSEATNQLAEEADPTSASAREREGPAGVLGIGFGLLLLVGLFASLALPRGRGLDPDELAQALLPGGPPTGYTVETAVALPTGERTLRLASADPAMTGPDELLFVQYRSNASVERDMRGGTPKQGGDWEKEQPIEKLERWERERDFAMHLTLEKGELAWDTWRAARATERALREDGTWRESVRVNLSLPDRLLILYAQWPDGVASDPDALRPVLRAVAMGS